MQALKVQLGFYCCLVVESEGRSGGLAMLWQNELNLTIMSYSKHHISAHIIEGECLDRWTLIGVTGTEKYQEEKKLGAC